MAEFSQNLCIVCTEQPKPASMVCLCRHKLNLLCNDTDCNGKHFNNDTNTSHHKYPIQILSKVTNDRKSIKAFNKKAKRVFKVVEGLEWNLKALNQFRESFKRAIDEIQMSIDRIIIEINEKIADTDRTIHSKIDEMTKSLYEDNWASELMETLKEESSKMLSKRVRIIETTLNTEKALASICSLATLHLNEISSSHPHPPSPHIPPHPHPKFTLEFPTCTKCGSPTPSQRETRVSCGEMRDLEGNEGMGEMGGESRWGGWV